MNLILSVDALSPQLTGIGRYTWELATRLPLHDEIGETQFYRNRQWIKNPARLLEVPQNVRRNQLRIKWPHKVRQAYWHWQCRGRVFHAPNYFLPSFVDRGVATIHDLSVFKFPETHPLERIKQFEREFEQTVSRAAHLITDSEVTRQELIAFLGCAASNVTAVHLGVDASFKPLSVSAVPVRINNYTLPPGGYTLCVSTLEPRKRIDCLLTAYNKLPLALRNRFPLVLAGGSGWTTSNGTGN